MTIDDDATAAIHSQRVHIVCCSAYRAQMFAAVLYTSIRSLHPSPQCPSGGRTPRANKNTTPRDFSPCARLYSFIYILCTASVHQTHLRSSPVCLWVCVCEWYIHLYAQVCGVVWSSDMCTPGVVYNENRCVNRIYGSYI